MLPLGYVIRTHNICFRSYADDKQLYVAIFPGDTYSFFKCILDINVWMSQNFLQLNQDKTRILV